MPLRAAVDLMESSIVSKLLGTCICTYGYASGMAGIKFIGDDGAENSLVGWALAVRGQVRTRPAC